VYASPHLVSPCERIVVAGLPIPTDAFAEWTRRLQPTIERVEASFFESVTAIAFADFAARGVDLAVVEVGLGGRLDATNVITPLVSVVTKVAREHTEYLGSDLAGIAREKAGIAKPDVPFVTGEPDPRLRAVLVETAHRLGARPIRAVEPRSAGRRPLGLRGPHQWDNAWVAVAALDALPPALGTVAGDDVPPSFAQAFLPGRFDVRGPWIFDVAHNPDGMRVLVAALAEARPPRPLHGLVGIRGDKDWQPMLTALLPALDRCVVTVPPSVPERQHWRLTDVRDWAAQRAPGAVLEVEPDFGGALERAQHGARTTLVTGSFHTVGDAMARLPGFAPFG